MRILIIEDKKSLREMLTEYLSDNNIVLSAESAEEGENLLLHQPEIVLCDLKLPGTSGLDFIEKHSTNYNNTYFIMMTAFGDIPTAVEAMKKGAYDFLPKPLDLNHLKFKINKIKELIRLKKKEFLKSGKQVICESSIFKNILNTAKKYAKGISPILITGESGVGKEVVANYIHNNSSRKNEVFYSVNCAAIPESLLESELFGYEKGAFTGALKQKRGLFEIADNGTLFLDEIGETSLNFQTKLLRVLENNKFSRVGGSFEISSNVRVILATNKNIEKLIENKLFREDLFYRISAFTIHIPPLRERKEDIVALANYFSNTLGLQIKGKPLTLDKKMITYLTSLKLKGNARELKNLIERWVIAGEFNKENNDTTTSNCLQLTNIEDKTYSEIIDLVEQKIFSLYLEKFNGNKQSVANKLKLNYKTLLTKLKKHNIK
jgi:DNA-binding NtrC family response regulator